MRGAYNTTFDLYYGPTSVGGPPGTVYLVGQPCRLVLYDQITPVSSPSFLQIAWLTTDEPLPGVPNVLSAGGGVLTIDYYAADQVAIPSGSAPGWYVDVVEQVSPTSGGGAYYRFRLVPLPYDF